jgi:hypothetical protein
MTPRSPVRSTSGGPHPELVGVGPEEAGALLAARSDCGRASEKSSPGSRSAKAAGIEVLGTGGVDIGDRETEVVDAVDHPDRHGIRAPTQ